MVHPPFPSLCRTSRSLLLVAFLVVGATPWSQAQMVPGIRAIGEARELELDRLHRSRDFTIQEIGCSVPANILLPGDRAALKFRVTNLTAAPVSGEGKIEAIRYGTKVRVGDIWEPLFVKGAVVDSMPFRVNLAPHASCEVTVEPKIPETFGGYVLVADLPGHGRAFAASLVRSVHPDGGREQFPAYALDLNGSSEEVARLFMRLGVKGARAEVNVFAADDKRYLQKWDKIVQQCKTLQENEVTLMITTASGDLPMPLGCPRPHLDDTGTFMETKRDLAWLPSADGEFEALMKKLCVNFGWPKGPVNAVELWNEPWEGISISGWGADMIRYREIFSAMARGVESARREVGVQVLTGGCGSSSNTSDKFFSDGNDAFLKRLDFCSIHYQAMSATPSIMRDFRNRREGPVRVWDTESWIANSEDRVGLVVASMHAMGQERAMGVYAGNVYEPQNVVLEGGKKETVVQAWATAAAVGASTKYVGQRPFQRLLFQNGLPWIFVFGGRPGQPADDGTVVIAGDLSGCYSRNMLLFRTVYGLKNAGAVRELKAKLAGLPATAPEAERKALQSQLDAASVLDDGSLTITDGNGQFQLLDFCGNPVPSANGQIVIPLDGYGYYLRTNGRAGSFARLLDELKSGRVEGYEPVEIVPCDPTERVEAEPTLRLRLTNVLNRRISGQLQASIRDADLPAEKVSMGPNETRVVQLKMAGVKPAADNSYPLRVTFDAGADGKVQRDETLHANVISKRTIKVDGDLKDWDGALPQPLAAEGIGANLTEKAWRPFEKFDDSTTQGGATGYLACDDRNFYFAARVFDRTPDEGMVRFETRNDENYFYPAIAHRYDEGATLVKNDRVLDAPNLQAQLLQLPEGEGRSRTAWESLATAYAVDLDLPELKQVALYLVSWDPLGRHNVNIEIINRTTGKLLDRQAVKGFADGKYVLYQLSGKVRIKVSSNNWLKAVGSGLFIDPAKEAQPTEGTSARFIGVDDRVQGNWKGHYGADGYAIAGAPERIPAGVRLAFSTEIRKLDLPWPDGVRRYTYRKRPDLPAGGPASHHDNVQIAFNVLPSNEKPWLSSPAGTPPFWMAYWDTDYEFALNEVAARYGGGTEIWRLQAPGMPRHHFYPRQPKSPLDGPVKNGQLVFRRDGNTRVVEAAIPWTEIPEVKKRIDAGERIKFSFRVNNNGGPSYELGTDRSVSKVNCNTFHNDWQTHWSNEVEFGVESSASAASKLP